MEILIVSIIHIQSTFLLSEIFISPGVLIFVLFAVIGIIAFLILKLRKANLLLTGKLTQIENFSEKEKQLSSEMKINEDLGTKNAELLELTKIQREELVEIKKDFEKLKGHLHEQVLAKTSELHTYLEKTKESNRLKDAFLEKISREIRTPLNSILGFINLLNDSNVSKIDRDYYLKFIRESGNNLLSLIDNIVDFSRLETGELMVEYKQCNLNLLLADLIDKYRSRFLREKPNLTLIYNKPEIAEESMADCKRILHVLDQLINNALKYTNEGKVEINYSINNEYHTFTVSDTGVGIDYKYHDIIFERFYQIKNESRDVFSGAGLGLTIVKRITDLLGGSLSLVSNVGKGTTFTLKIPYKEIKSKDQSISIKDQNFDWHDKTILIAEDEDSNFHFLEAVLKKTKVNILWASDGVKFLEIMNENKNIDLVLLDIKMPGINGFNAIKVVRQQNINIPVIAQTAFNQPEDKQRCLDSGCNDYLAKPIDKDLLFNKISIYF